MRYLSALLGLFFFSIVNGQYYYNDIVATQQSQQQYQLLRANKVKKMVATSFEEDHSATEGFKLEQELTIDGKNSLPVLQIFLEKVLK